MSADFKCPYCTAGQFDHELYDEDTYEYECGMCEKKFKVTVTISIDYYAFGSCKLNEEMPHQLKLRHKGADFLIYNCKKCRQEFYDWQLEGGKHQKLKSDEYFIDTQQDLKIGSLA